MTTLARSYPLKYVASCNPESLPETTPSDTPIEYVDIGNVDEIKGITDTEQLDFGAAPSRARRKVRDGDVIVSTVRTYLRAIAAIRNPPPNLVVSTGFAVLRPGPWLNKRFFCYAIRSKKLIDEIVARSVGVSYPAITANELIRLSIDVPSIEHQMAVADFLDRETAKADALIAKYERLTELLEEKRIGLITQAITKGVDPSAPMKDSKEWMGQIPQDWPVYKLKHIAHLQSGEHIPATDIEEVGTYPVFGGNGLRGYTERYTHTGDYPLVGRQGALCGNVNYGSGNFWASEHAVVVTPIMDCPAYWLGELLRAMNLGQYSMTAAQPGLTVETIANLKVPVPPPNERVAIAEYLRSQCAALDLLRAKCNEAIRLTNERRSVLITAAVTGQIDVKNYREDAAEILA